MQFSLKSAIAATLLAVASTSAMAQVSVPPQPAPGPVPTSATGSGGVVVSIWDEVRGVSVIQYLGLTLNDILPDADMTTPGTVLNFGQIGQFDTVFGASDAANVQYHVFAADSVGTGAFAGRQIAFTSANTSYTVNNSATAGAANASFQWFTNSLNGNGGCNGANPCVAMDNQQLHYAGADIGWDNRINGQLPVSIAGTIGTALNFFHAASGTLPTGAATVTAYASGDSFGQWLLDASGNLTYSVAPVPLPAAAWLLLSGLLGMGAVARRRNAA